ncbi:MAG: tetratricopeptide repeat protein, partial [Pseudomonadota bacterium]
MNPSDQGPDNRSAATGGPKSSPAQLQQLFGEAVAHHQSQRLAQADQLYRRILAEAPNHPETLHLLGMLTFQRGQPREALALVSQAIEVDNRNAQYHFHQGIILQSLGALDEAAGAYQNALGLNGALVEALSNLGNVHRERGRFDDAVEALEQVVRMRPDFAPGYNNLGVALKDRGEAQRAIDAYQQALRLNPNFAEAQANVGIALVSLGRPQEAVQAFERAVAVNPRYVKGHFNLGKTLLSLGQTNAAIKAFRHALQIEPSFAKAHHMLGLAHLRERQPDAALSAFRASADLAWNHGRPSGVNAAFPSRLRHDADQAQYLLEKGIWTDEHRQYATALRAASERLAASNVKNEPVRLTPAEAEQLAPSFNRILHYAQCPTLAQGALNPALDVADIEQRYNASQPEIVYVDALLREETLLALRQFCFESTIWKTNFNDGYLGAFLSEGFSSPLLLQVAEELRTTFPNIFRGHPLKQAWAFKQDNQLNPVGIHADAAAVNVNLWITQQDANLDPSSGGLTVWNKEAPSDWDFARYNSVEHKPKIREFLQASGAEPITVPY